MQSLFSVTLSFKNVIEFFLIIFGTVLYLSLYVNRHSTKLINRLYGSMLLKGVDSVYV